MGWRFECARKPDNKTIKVKRNTADVHLVQACNVIVRTPMRVSVQATATVRCSIGDRVGVRVGKANGSTEDTIK